MPRKRKVSDIKSNLLRPALTSHFEVEIGVPSRQFTNTFLPQNGVIWNSPNQDKLRLLCSEATLPGSNLATLELTSDFHGVTERHAYRRVYDDRIDLTFYVDASNYLPIRFFETWIKYISDESVSTQPDKNAGSENDNYFYRVRYPEGNGNGSNGYVSTGLKVIKFERDYRQQLEYRFVKAFPISISSMPVSYDSSSLLKCIVSMTYIRYVLIPSSGEDRTSAASSSDGLSPIEQSQFNNLSDYLANPQFGVDTTGGIPTSSLLASGNSAQVFEGDEIIGSVNSNSRAVESGLPYVGRNIGPISF
jgi:hypothetical protein